MTLQFCKKKHYFESGVRFYIDFFKIIVSSYGSKYISISFGISEKIEMLSYFIEYFLQSTSKQFMSFGKLYP